MNAHAPAARADRHWHAGLEALRAARWADAHQAFQQMVKLTPHNASGWTHLAAVLLQQGHLQEALDAALKARQLAPDSALACSLHADCLSRQNRHREATEVYASLPATVSRDADFLSAHGTALLMDQRPREAIKLYIQAVGQQIGHALTHYRMGLAFKHLERDKEASTCFRTAITTDRVGEVRSLALPQLLTTRMQACDWEGLDDDIAALVDTIDGGDEPLLANISPFSLLALPVGPLRQRRVAQAFVAQAARPLKPLPPPGPRAPGRIRLGYLSADFHHHATAMLMTELLERRDGQRFEVFLYSHGGDDGSATSARVRAAGDYFIDVRTETHEAIARRMRADGIDIAIDLKGHTRQTRFELLALRPAPVQVSFLGYPGTTGADFLDYVIGDPVVTPLGHAPHYSERIAQLPASYQPNDRQRPLPPAPPRAELGLPQDAVVLCCFNQSYKFLPAMVDLWAQVMTQAPHTVLWLLSWNAHGQRHLVQAFAARGIPSSRLVFADKVPLARHIARLQQADLFLDTWPCNAHTTASEALWAGVPVLTVPGDTFASRVAASLVSACGLPQMACADAATYVRMAVALAHKREALQALKQHLREERLRLPLFDSARYARDYEALLQRMFERQQASLPPDHLPARPAE
ncbi:MAG: tetratricopeptide repeat protein [Aquincola sp.]|nr:tetratricopeptide repeat protein [Aquincola sp.]